MKELVLEVIETIDLIDQMPTRLISARRKLNAAIKDRDLAKENLRVEENRILIDDLAASPEQKRLTGTNERLRAAQLEELTRPRRELLRMHEEKVVKAEQDFDLEENTFQAIQSRALLLHTADSLLSRMPTIEVQE